MSLMANSVLIAAVPLLGALAFLLVNPGHDRRLHGRR